MFRNSGWPKGADDSRTCEPTNHWSALRRRKAAPNSQCLAGTNPLYPPKLGDRNRTGIQPCANELTGVAAVTKSHPIAIRSRRFIRLLPWIRIGFFSPLTFCGTAAEYTPIADPRPAFVVQLFSMAPLAPDPSARPAMYAEGGDCVVSFPDTV